MRCKKGDDAMKRRWKWTLTGFLTALALCLCPRFAGAAPHEDMPTVKTFAFSCSGTSADQMCSYQIGKTKRGRLATIDEEKTARDAQAVCDKYLNM